MLIKLAYLRQVKLNRKTGIRSINWQTIQVIFEKQLKRSNIEVSFSVLLFTLNINASNIFTKNYIVIYILVNYISTVTVFLLFYNMTYLILG